MPAPPTVRWSFRSAETGAADRLAREIGTSALISNLLVGRGLEDPALATAFLDASLSRSLRSPMLFREMPVAAARLLQAIRRRERVFVYGDYDVDGITGSTQLLLFLRELGAEAEVFIPHRIRDGYGLRIAALRELAARGARLIVTVDCGAAAHAEVSIASELGIEMIVCDHHQAPDQRPPALAVLNPAVPDGGFPFAGLSAAGVVFYLLLGTRMLLRETGERGPDLRRYLDLVALGTVADLVPLLEENRALVKHGLREIARTQRPGLQALLQVSGIDVVSVSSIGFGLGPRINASGRLADARQAVDLLATRSPDEARRLAGSLDQHNQSRRALEQAIYEEADRQIRELPDWEGYRTFVLASEGWHTGVVGIVASRLVERYFRPVVLLVVEGGSCRGSGRSIPAVHLFGALRQCESLLERYGGHRMAAGVTLDTELLPAFRERFEKAVRDQTTQTDFQPMIAVDAKVAPAEISLGMVDEISRLEPFGPGNPRPVLMAERLMVNHVRVIGDRHLKVALQCPQSGVSLDAIGFRMAERASEVAGEIDILFSPETNAWRGRERLQLTLRSLRKHQQ